MAFSGCAFKTLTATPLLFLQVGAQLADDFSQADIAARTALLAKLLGHYKQVVLRPESGFKEVAVAVRAIGALARPTARLQGPQVRASGASIC